MTLPIKKKVNGVEMVDVKIEADERNSETFGGAVKRGDVKDDVLKIQKALISKGFDSVGEPDGAFGLKTEAAIQEFQGSVGLPRTGVLDVKTANTLRY